MIDRQKIVLWLRDVVNGNCRKDDSEMAKQAMDLILAPPADLTQYLAAAAILTAATGAGNLYEADEQILITPEERTIKVARALRDASKEA